MKATALQLDFAMGTYGEKWWPEFSKKFLAIYGTKPQKRTRRDRCAFLLYVGARYDGRLLDQIK